MSHYPVMAANILKSITQMGIKRPLVVADCNFGLGGHSRAILENFKNSQMYGQY